MADILREHEYVTLKVFVSGNPQAKNEEAVFKHLKTIKSDHGGAKFIRTLRDSFKLPGEKGPHVCLVHDALGVTLKQLRELSDGEKLEFELFRPIIYDLLFALDYLHSQAKVVHTGTVLVCILKRFIDQ
jgi:serine/threonine-protein kinase SRPK3